jgi:MurNAc alpha-1-phosphate uridylyltransferase
MLFAAGFGTRMRPLTDDRPKPLIEVAGRALIDHALALAEAVSPPRIVVNLHYLGEKLAHHLEGRGVILSWEREAILDTAGGLKRARPLLADDPVLTLNTDAVWTGENPLPRLIDAWQDREMDALLLLLPVEAARGHSGRADFTMDAEGRIEHPPRPGAQGYVYLGTQIIRTAPLEKAPGEVLPMWALWSPAIAAGRAYGLVHRGGWCDVGHPGGIAEAETMLRDTPLG